jgi:hypothetical protein
MIEFQFFADCPHAGETLQNLRDVMSELGITGDQLIILEVPDIATSRRMQFQGSPTILVKGKDIYTGEKPTGFNYSCRLYEFDGEKTEAIPKYFIRDKLAGYK